jgi:hypothetical protein
LITGFVCANAGLGSVGCVGRICGSGRACSGGACGGWGGPDENWGLGGAGVAARVALGGVGEKDGGTGEAEEADAATKTGGGGKCGGGAGPGPPGDPANGGGGPPRGNPGGSGKPGGGGLKLSIRYACIDKEKIARLTLEGTQT